MTRTIKEKLTDAFDRALARVHESSKRDVWQTRPAQFDDTKNQLTTHLSVDGENHRIYLYYDDAEPNGTFITKFDRIGIASSASDTEIVIVDQTNTAFEDNDCLEVVIKDICSQITDPIQSIPEFDDLDNEDELQL